MPWIHDDSSRCFYCDLEFGTVISPNSKPLIKTKDHIIPKSRNGSGRTLNKIYACMDYNGLKSNRTPEEFTAYLYERIGKIEAGDGKKTGKYSIERLSKILANNNKLIDAIEKYKWKLTNDTHNKPPPKSHYVKKRKKKKLKAIIKELGLDNLNLRDKNQKT